MKVKAELVVTADCTVQELIDSLDGIPRDAKVSVVSHEGDRFGTDWHTIVVSWEVGKGKTTVYREATR